MAYSRRSNNRSQSKGKSKGLMLNFGTVWMNEGTGKAVFKADIKLKNTDTISDSEDNSYSPEEAVELLAKALLSGKGVSIYLFDSDSANAEWSGNARINIEELAGDSKNHKREETKRTKSAPAKRRYQEPEEEEEELDEELEDMDELPY